MPSSEVKYRVVNTETQHTSDCTGLVLGESTGKLMKKRKSLPKKTKPKILKMIKVVLLNCLKPAPWSMYNRA